MKEVQLNAPTTSLFKYNDYNEGIIDSGKYLELTNGVRLRVYGLFVVRPALKTTDGHLLIQLI